MASSPADGGPNVLRTIADWALPWLCSTTAHMLLLVAMALSYQWIREEPIGPAARSETGLRTVFISGRGDDAVDGAGTDAQAGDSRYYDDEPAPSTPRAGDAGGGGASGTSTLSSLLNEKPSVSLAGILPASGDGLAGGASPQRGIGSAAGLPGQPRGTNQVRGGYARTGVFGISGEGYKFAYVFDRSGSMDGHGGAPLSAAKAELIASLKDLGQTHQFQIIFYNEHPRVFNPTGTPSRLVFGTDQNKYLAQKFVGSITADGATRHEEALEMAVRMGPDVIFFLTDADEPRLSSKQLAHIAQINRGSAINAIEFGYGPQSDSENFLVKLARQNGGKHVYIDVARLPIARR